MSRRLKPVLAVTGIVLFLLALDIRTPGSPLVADAVVAVAEPLPDVWGSLSNLSQAHLYVPGISRTVITTDQGRGEGASRRVYRSSEDYLNETVTEWTEDRGFTLRLHDDEGRAMAPFREASFRYSLHSQDSKNTRVELQLSVLMPAGRLGERLGALLLQGLLDKQVREVGDSLTQNLHKLSPGL